MKYSEAVKGWIHPEYDLGCIPCGVTYEYDIPIYGVLYCPKCLGPLLNVKKGNSGLSGLSFGRDCGSGNRNQGENPV